MGVETEQRVAILGGRSTIAQAVADRLRETGARYALIARDLSGINDEHAAHTAECALTDLDAVTGAISDAQSRMNGLTGIVNCAGSMVLKPAHLTSSQEFDEVIEANLKTAFVAVSAAAKLFRVNEGAVVLVSSAAGTLGMLNHEAIAAAKAGVEGLVRSAAATYASRGIRFNAVAPGLTATKMTEKLLGGGSRKISEGLHPLGRLGEPGDVASAICWLLDPAQRWVTGQVIGVDGGLSRVQPKPKIAVASR